MRLKELEAKEKELQQVLNDTGERINEKKSHTLVDEHDE